MYHVQVWCYLGVLRERSEVHQVGVPVFRKKEAGADPSALKKAGSIATALIFFLVPSR